jgi:hypothetical protein
LLSLVKVLYELVLQHTPWLKKKEEEGDKRYAPPDEYDLASPTEYKNPTGLGLTDGAYSSALGRGDAEKEGVVSATLNRPPTILSQLHFTAGTYGWPRQKRSLSHRILLAWLPWLNMFKWARQSLTPELIRNSAIFSSISVDRTKQRVKGGAGFEVLGVKQMYSSTMPEDARQGQGLGHHVRAQSSSPTTNGTADESPTTALLTSPSQQLHPGQGGLMAEMTDQIDMELLSNQQSQSQSRGGHRHRRMSSDSTADAEMGSGTGMAMSAYEGRGYA